MKAQAPCKDCKDRQLGCHDTCKKYRQFKIDKETESNMLRKNKSTEMLLNSYVIKQKEKYRRARG